MIAHPMAGRSIKFCIFLCRFTSVMLSPMFLALCAIPLGFSTLMVVILGAVGFSVSWNISAMLHGAVTGRQPPCQLILVADIMIFPSVLIIFGVIAKTNGLNDFTVAMEPQSRETLGFVFLITMGILHVFAFFLSGLLMTASGTNNFGTSRPAPTLTEGPRARPVASLAGNGRQEQNVPMDVLARPRRAFQKQRASAGPRSSSASSYLPMYQPQDPVLPPSYEQVVEDAPEVEGARNK